MTHRNVSIARRMGLGLGLLLVILAALLGSVFHFQAESAALLNVYAERTRPLSDGARELESALLRADIGVRAFQAEAQRLPNHEDSVRAIHAEVRGLAALPMEPDGAALFRRAEPLVEHYLAEASRLVEDRQTGRLPDNSELRLASTRDTALAALASFSELKNGKERRVLAAMQRAGNNLSRAILASLLLAALSFAAFGWFTVQSIRKPTGELVRLAAALRAQSEEIQSQNEQLQAQAEEIRGQNDRLTEQGERLRQQSQRLAESEQRKTEFLGLLAHELRNPMAGITTSLYVLSHPGATGEQTARARAVIERQTRQLRRLIDDLLDVTRINRGKVELQIERVDLVHVLNECLEDNRAAFQSANIALELHVAPGPIAVKGDRARLCQVICNLIDNAVKFSDKRIAVSLERDSGRARLCVADNGAGIALALLDRLFQPFAQGDAGVSRGNDGLGLGLALVKALVDLHGGSVEAQSEGPGRGASFVVTLPLAEAADAALEARSREPAV